MLTYDNGTVLVTASGRVLLEGVTLDEAAVYFEGVTLRVRISR